MISQPMAWRRCPTDAHCLRQSLSRSRVRAYGGMDGTNRYLNDQRGPAGPCYPSKTSRSTSGGRTAGTGSYIGKLVQSIETVAV